MLVSDVATRVKRQFGDEQGAQITDADILRWVNDAQTEIATQNKLLQTVSTSSSVVGTQSYTTPTDMLALRGVRYDKLRLSVVSMDDIDAIVEDSTYDSGTPEYYWMIGESIYLWPKPDAVKTITIYYTQKPATLVNQSDPISLPPQFDNRIIEYCIAQAAELDDDLEHYQLKMAQFQQGIDASKGNIEMNESDDEYPSISYSPSEYY